MQPRYRYKLDARPGKRKAICPACKRRSLTNYVDESGMILDASVGRCDHENGCGYHKTPRDYFREHPTSADWRDRPSCFNDRYRTPSQERTSLMGIDESFGSISTDVPEAHDTTSEPCATIPMDIVRKLNERAMREPCDFISFLSDDFDSGEVSQVASRYLLGVTKDGDVVFPQVDASGRVRTGKIMKYDRSTGHRIKDENCPGRVNWLHVVCKKVGLIPESFNLCQCLFGEHLLRERPDATVAIVESEKTAIIAALAMPEYVWLATGGINGLNGPRMAVLRGRRIMVFPDVDAYGKWTAKVAEIRQQMPHLDISVSRYLENTATKVERANHIDIGDRLIAERQHERPLIRGDTPDSESIPPDPESVPAEGLGPLRGCFDAETLAEVEALASDLDLELRSISIIKEEIINET